jgi:hypothetical protein
MMIFIRQPQAGVIGHLPGLPFFGRLPKNEKTGTWLISFMILVRIILQKDNLTGKGELLKWDRGTMIKRYYGIPLPSWHFPRSGALGM